MLSDVMQSAEIFFVMLSAIMLYVVVLNVVILSVASPTVTGLLKVL